MSDSKRARLPRKAAATVSYAEKADALTESDDDDDAAARLERERAAKRKKAGKGKQKEEQAPQPVKSKEPEDAYLWRPVPVGIISKGMKGQSAAYTPKRIDLTAILPYEILLEICSHMRPISLWRMLYLNKRLYALLSSTSAAALWHAAIDGVADELGGYRSYTAKRLVDFSPLPLVNGRPLNLIKIAGLLFRSDCQLCGQETTGISFCLLLRICDECQDHELVSLSEVRKDEAFEDLHSETLGLVKTVDTAPNRPSKKRPFALRSEILRVHQDLDDLQLLDDSKPRSVAPTTGSSRRAAGTRRTSAAGSSEAAIGQVTSLVADYVSRRKNSLKEEAKVVQSLVDHGGRGAVKLQIAEEVREASEYAKQPRQGRRQAILTRIRADKPFNSVMTKLTIPDWHLHPDVFRSRPLASDEWQVIAPRIRAGFARCVAYNILGHEGLKPSIKSSEKLDALRARAIEQPDHLDDTLWSYVRPQIDVLIEDQKSQALADQVAREKQNAESKRLEKVRVKVTFFRARLDEILTAQPDKAAKAALPVSSDFVHLSTVSALYDDPEFAIDEARHDADLATWSRHSDAILEEVADYAVHVRLEALRTILAATTDMSADAIEKVDADALLESEYDDDFFARPSSWVVCPECVSAYWATDDYGPLQAVLEHRFDRHSRLPMPTPAGLGNQASTVTGQGKASPKVANHAFVSPVTLPLEFACTVLSLCELGSLDPNDSTLSPNDMDDLLEEARFVWRNPPRSRTSRHTCRELFHQILREANSAKREGKVLPVPDIARRELKWRERFELHAARQRKALAAAAAEARAKQDSATILDNPARGTGYEDECEDDDDTLARDWYDAGSDDQLGSEKVQSLLNEEEEKDDEDAAE